jgi:GDP-4-dehydro-6-deoxy-D-mannose reductase
VRVLITGATGFVGGYLVEHLRAGGHEVTGTSLEETAGFMKVDMRDPAAIAAAVVAARPERVFHLAAQSRAALSWKEPALTYEINVSGTHYLLEALHEHHPDAGVLLPCTSDQYGVVAPDECPIDESTHEKPVSPYAVSKSAQEGVGRTFHFAFGMFVVATRAFMHVGPGQPPTFATGDWARQIALAEAGLRARELSVGNLDVAREFADVRDVVTAYVQILENGTPGETYNVATGDARTLREALRILLDAAEVEMEVRVDPGKIRPADPPLLQGDGTKLRRATGWEPRRKPEQTLVEVLDWWREEVASGRARDLEG